MLKIVRPRNNRRQLNQKMTILSTVGSNRQQWTRIKISNEKKNVIKALDPRRLPSNNISKILLRTISQWIYPWSSTRKMSNTSLEKLWYSLTAQNRHCQRRCQRRLWFKITLSLSTRCLQTTLITSSRSWLWVWTWAITSSSAYSWGKSTPKSSFNWAKIQASILLASKKLLTTKNNSKSLLGLSRTQTHAIQQKRNSRAKFRKEFKIKWAHQLAQNI